MKRPIIGISAVLTANEKSYTQKIAYAKAIWNAGGEPVFLPCHSDTSNCKQMISMLDGLLAPGGRDIDPNLYGEEVLEECGKFILSEDHYDMELVKEAVEQKKPVLGICRGMQLINVLYGGNLYQDIPTQVSKELVHTRINPEKETMHTVVIEKGSYLAKVLGKTEDVEVNSSHHQAVKDVADGFRVTATAPDGVIEAMENEDASILCVQWHPERLQDMEKYRKLIVDFVTRCK